MHFRNNKLIHETFSEILKIGNKVLQEIFYKRKVAVI